jgi:hypothetical protein
VKARTTSCDDGMRFDLTCDACGASFSATPQLRHDPAALWRATAERGWALTPNGPSGTHRCGDCRPSTTLSSVRTGDAR